jgi:hypothetical protein
MVIQLIEEGSLATGICGRVFLVDRIEVVFYRAAPLPTSSDFLREWYGMLTVNRKYSQRATAAIRASGELNDLVGWFAADDGFHFKVKEGDITPSLLKIGKVMLGLTTIV